MRYTHWVFFSAAALATSALHASESVDVQLVRGGRNLPLSEPARSLIAEQLPKLFATCSLNSRDQPNLFASSGLTTIWADTEAKDHLRLRLAKPVEIRTVNSPAIPVQEFLLGLGDPNLPGPEVSRAGGNVVAYVKCSGADVIRFVCMPELRAAMPATYHGLCSLLGDSKNGASD
jgi:hypothetical protein